MVVRTMAKAGERSAWVNKHWQTNMTMFVMERYTDLRRPKATICEPRLNVLCLSGTDCCLQPCLLLVRRTLALHGRSLLHPQPTPNRLCLPFDEKMKGLLLKGKDGKGSPWR